MDITEGHVQSIRFALLLLVGAAVVVRTEVSRSQTVHNRSALSYNSVCLDGVPHVRQRPDFRGEACAEMFLAKLGRQIDQDFVFDQAGLDPIHGRGCHTRELVTALRRIGFRTGHVWFAVAAADAERQLESQFRALHADLEAGVPSIVCMRYDEQPQTTEHFRLLLGYDAETDEVLYHEPALDDGAYRRLPRRKLLELWPLKYEQRQWTVVRIRLEPGRLIAGRSATTLTDADYAQHIRQLQKQLSELSERQVKRKQERDAEIAAEARQAEEAVAAGNEYEPRKLTPRLVSDFHIVVQKPFVVLGDDSPRSVRQWSAGTIQWAVEQLKRQYFSQDPDHIINIWLFKDEQSYEQNVVDLFGRQPHTPFGYYSPWHKALVMNIDTGGGTLVHEIVHPFMAANFPECPSWLNEGLGSLYEQCHTHNGQIWGLTNWRLRGLHEALQDEEHPLPSFEELCGTTTREFYDDDPGTNYAQARYLCYYLQEQGLLGQYYHEFRRSVADDPTGYRTLQRILDEEDMAEFQKKWTEFVLQLRF